MSNVLSKLSKASADAAPVIKGERVPGMHFNPLQHDEVQAVAMKALKAINYIQFVNMKMK